MGLFKDDDEVASPNGENNNMNGFEDTNVDTDLLSQIFAGGGDNFSLDEEEEKFSLDDEALNDAVPIEEDGMAGEISEETIESLAGEIPEETLESITGEIPEETLESIISETPEEASESMAEEMQGEISESLTGEISEETIESITDDVPEETVESLMDMPSDEDVETEPESIPEKTEDIKVSNTLSSEDTTISNVMDDVVDEEAQVAMEEERTNGTVTVITENTTINGSISSDGSLEVMGVITGDIECLGKVYINGRVSGGVIASEIFVNTPKLTGGLRSEGTVKIGVGTMIIGGISGTSAYIAGAVKGNIDIDGPVIIESTAIVKGDIKARSITINAGAVVDGYCSLNYASVDLDKFFEEE